jgi:site-specific recombinase XerD
MDEPTALALIQPTDLAAVPTSPAAQNPAIVYLAGLSTGSRRTMRQALDVIAGILTANTCDHRTLPWGALRFQHTQAVRSVLMERYGPATANKMLSALRNTLRTAWNLNYMNAEEYQRAVNLKTVIGEQPEAAAGRALTHGEWIALLAACSRDSSPAGARDAAIIALLKVTGLRRAELAALQLEDYNQVTQTLTVQGKRKKVRTIPLENQGALDALSDWLHFRGMDAGSLFFRISKCGDLMRTGLSDQGVYHLLRKRGLEAGVDVFTPHDLRRTFAGDLLDAGADLSTVQKLMGHAQANTTARYDRRGERAKRSAVQKLHVPYKRRYLNILSD